MCSTVWRAQPWPPRINVIQVFDRFLTGLMDRMIKTFFCPLDLCLFSGDVIGSSEINSHQTCQKPIKNLYQTYTKWPRLDAQDCNINMQPSFTAQNMRLLLSKIDHLISNCVSTTLQPCCYFKKV